MIAISRTQHTEGHGNLIHKISFRRGDPYSAFMGKAHVHFLKRQGPWVSHRGSRTKTGCTPGIGNVAQLGFAGVTPARFEIKIPPVSVCHQVSTMGHFFLPIFSSYQCQASSLIGSPTVPNTFKEERSFPLNKGFNTKTHQAPYSRWRSIENIHLVLIQ